MYWVIEKKAFDAILMPKLAQPVSFETMKDSAASSSKLKIDTFGSVAVIPISGVLMKNPSEVEKWFFGAINSLEVANLILSAANDKDVSGIVLNVSSPGGTVAGTPELAEAVRAAGKKKKVVAHVDDFAASGAYWVASQAEAIYANQYAVIGSIGVRVMMYDDSKWFENIGIKAVPVDTGKFKSAGMPGVEITDEQVSMYQDIVDAHFVDFRKAVMKGRRMDEKGFEKVADAQIFHAGKAVKVGLIDGVLGLNEVIAGFGPQKQGRKTQVSHQKLKLYSV